MKITKKQIKRIIKEFYSADVENFLRSNAEQYHLDTNLDFRAIKMLLMDDFMDNVGYSEDVSEYKDLINQLAAGELSEKANKKATIHEGTLYVFRGYGGTPMVEDEEEEPIGAGEMIRALIDAGDNDIFDFPQGVSKGALQKLLKQDKENQQGSIENWDNDVFSNYYNVDLDRVIRLYARLKNHTIEKVSEEDEDDGTNDFEEYYS